MAAIDPRKLMLINEFKNMSQGKTTEEILPLMLAITQKSNSMGLNFTEEETNQLISSFTADMSPAEKKKVDMMMNLVLTMKKNTP